MPSKTPAVDVQEIIAEVAKRHGIMFGPNDPVFALITLNEMVVKKTMEVAMAPIAATMDRYGASTQRAAIRAAQMFGEQAREVIQELHLALQNGMAGARMESDRSQRIWVYVALSLAVLLCAVSFWLGRLTALH